MAEIGPLSPGSPEPVDAVIAWVDGSDPAWRARMAAALNLDPAVNATPTRFAANGEILWTVASILRFAPFVRTIHILTDRQDPMVTGPLARIFGAEAAAKIRIVDHADAFHGHLDLLPTFNSLTIANMVHRLPNLAEHFIYFNDDTMLIRPVLREEFFVDGRPVLRGHWVLSLKHQLRLWLKHRRAKRAPYIAGAIETKFHEVQVAAAQLAGHRFLHWRIGHTPHPCRKATMSWFERSHPERFRANISHRTRHFSQISALALAASLEMRESGKTTRPEDVAYVFLPGRTDQLAFLRRALSRARHRGLPFACFQSLDLASDDAVAFLKDWLDHCLLAPPGQGSADGLGLGRPAIGGRRPGQSVA